MKYLRNNFYIRMLIRTLKEHKVYNKKFYYKLEVLVSNIYDKDRLSLPHMLFDNLGVLENKNNMVKTYLGLIKTRYISDIIKLISNEKSHSDETIIYDTTKMWEKINHGFLCVYLKDMYNIPRNYIGNNKYFLFYREILHKKI